MGRSAGAAADPIDAGRQLNADYVVTGNLEAGGDPLRVTLQLADVHSSARLWSQTISPVLEQPNTAAAEAEVAGRAESLLGEAILDAERTRLSSAGDIAKTTWGCVLLGFGGTITPPLRLDGVKRVDFPIVSRRVCSLVEELAGIAVDEKSK